MLPIDFHCDILIRCGYDWKYDCSFLLETIFVSFYADSGRLSAIKVNYD